MSGSPHNSKKLTPFQASHYLAQRLEILGFEPYQSMQGRYLVLMQDAPGEIFDLGRPLKGSRFFSKNAIRKDSKIISDFEEFTKESGLNRCYFWGIGLPCAKASCDGLEEALRRFNSQINNEFTVLRKQFGFEMLLLTIHVRYDRFSQLFDLHAHFVCRIEDDSVIDDVKHHLRRKFSKHDFPLDPIRSAGACVTYMHSGIFNNHEMLTWPDDVLAAAWRATEQRFRFSRVGGAFAEWRARKVAANDNPEARAKKQRVKDNRRATADPRQIVVSKDRFLGKVMATVRGTKIYALLFENSAPPPAQSNIETAEPAPKYYPSATGGVTQKQGKRLQHVIRNAIEKLKARFEQKALQPPQRGRFWNLGTLEGDQPPSTRNQNIWKAFTIMVKTALAWMRGQR